MLPARNFIRLRACLRGRARYATVGGSRPSFSIDAPVCIVYRAAAADDKTRDANRCGVGGGAVPRVKTQSLVSTPSSRSSSAFWTGKKG
jgi:hypothetical protein